MRPNERPARAPGQCIYQVDAFSMRLDIPGQLYQVYDGEGLRAIGCITQQRAEPFFGWRLYGHPSDRPYTTGETSTILDAFRGCIMCYLLWQRKGA